VLHRIYGGGPAIIRVEPDLNSTTPEFETDTENCERDAALLLHCWARGCLARIRAESQRQHNELSSAEHRRALERQRDNDKFGDVRVVLHRRSRPRPRPRPCPHRKEPRCSASAPPAAHPLYRHRPPARPPARPPD